jgi:hypothetical protein
LLGYFWLNKNCLKKAQIFIFFTLISIYSFADNQQDRLYNKFWEMVEDEPQNSISIIDSLISTYQNEIS